MAKYLKFSVLALLVGVFVSYPAEHATAQPQSDQPRGGQSERSQPIPDQYIVVFRDDVANPRATAARLAREVGADVTHVYTHALRGFAARMSPQAVTALERNPLVRYIEQDATVQLDLTSQTNATWGLDRIDQDILPLNQVYSYNHTGRGVTAYIIDSGIRYGHVDFGGRARLGVDYVGDGLAGDDCNGHGTHVAGTVGGTTYGVAKDVSLVSVRVFPCSGGSSWSTVIASVDWVTANGALPAVVNMSLGGGASSTVNTAVNNSVAAGFVYAVAAGNSNDDACKYSPASAASALTVGSTDSNDGRSSFSNYGSCVDIFAPGRGITSAWYTSDGAIATISGTSMASPHVAGVAALLLEQNPTASPPEIETAILAGASRGVVTNSRSTKNNLVYALATIGEPVPTPPTVLSVGVSDIGETSARALGDVTASGSASVTDRGFCFVENDRPVKPCMASAESGTGTFTVLMSGLANETSYSVKAYATNKEGTSYGDTLTFSTLREDGAVPSVDRVGSSMSRSGPWRDVRVDWEVSDDVALQSVNIQVRLGDETLESLTQTVSGTQASGTTNLRMRSDPDNVRLTVTDLAGKNSNLGCNLGISCGGGITQPPGDGDLGDPPAEDPPVGELAGSGTKNGRSWTATVTLTGKTGDTTAGTWSTNIKGGCTIGSGTECSFSLGNISNGTSSVSYTDQGSYGTVMIFKP